MWRKVRVVVLVLALATALAPSAPRAETVEVAATKLETVVAYAGCIGSVVLLPLTVVGVFAMSIACANALVISLE